MLSRAKEKARVVMCLSNQRQGSLSYRIAVEDAKWRFDAGNEIYGWLTNEFGRPGGPWICPDAPSSIQAGSVQFASDAVLGTAKSAFTNGHWRFRCRPYPMVSSRAFATSYSLNQWLFDNFDPPNAFSDQEIFHQESQIKRPSQTPLLADGSADLL